jgi:hypothetical protein
MALPPLPYRQALQKWRELADRRRAHFVDLQKSGRWRRYYTEEQFRARMQEVVQAADAWAKIVPYSAEERKQPA